MLASARRASGSRVVQRILHRSTCCAAVSRANRATEAWFRYEEPPIDKITLVGRAQKPPPP
jgi:hypothetical protein